MKMQLAVILGVLIVGSACTLYADESTGTTPPEKTAAVAKAVYVCPDCETMAMKEGKCEKCGKEMVQKHMLGMQDGKAMLCECTAGCACDAKGVKDGKCACGKDVKTMSAKGMYACACPGGKCCSTVSDKPGKCKCGEEMKKIE